MKNLLNIEGNYFSTYAFVQHNNLEITANEVLGEGWSAEDDVEQIQQIIDHLNIGDYSVGCNEHIDADGDDIEVKKIHGIEGIDEALRQLKSLYDVCDDYEKNQWTHDDLKKPKHMRDMLNKLQIFIHSLKN